MILKFLLLIAIIGMKRRTYLVSAECEGSQDSGLNTMKITLGSNIVWPSRKFKCAYADRDKYDPSSIIHTRAQMYNGKVIVISPRYKKGVPFTVGEIHLTASNKCNLPTKPYPCWQLHEECSCDSIQNAVDLYLDCKGILWILDTGVVNTIQCPEKKCGPKVIGFNSESNRVVSFIQLCSLTCPTSRLQYITADYDSDAGAFLYISDAGSRAILVWDVKNDKGYRIVLPKATMTGGCKRDVLYLNLVRKKCDSNLLYFSYLGGERLYYVKTANLQNHSSVGCIIDVGKKPGKMVMLGTDNGSVLFFRIHGENNVYMWNSELAFKTTNFILAQEGDECRVATHVFSGKNKYMWVLESNFQDYLKGTVGCVGASTCLHPLMRPTGDFKN